MTLSPHLLFCAFLTSVSYGQISVKLTMDRPTFLVNEPVTAVVTLTNRSGREQLLHSEAQGKIVRSWLEFGMRHSGGDALPRVHHGAFRAAKLPSGQSISRRVNLSQLYSIAKQGNFSTNARVQVGDDVYSSNSGHFTVSDGSTYFTQPFGAPGTSYPKREYRVVAFNDGKSNSIYAAVHDAQTKRSLSTGRISEVLLFKKPQATLDRQNQLHILYLTNPEIFVHAIVNKDGKLVKSSFYKRAGAGSPVLQAQRDGKILVRGGVLYDPKKEAQKQNGARKISERP